MIKFLRPSNHALHIKLTPSVMALISKSIQFSKLTVIIGDNGSGKSQFIGLLCALIDPGMDYDSTVYGSGIRYSPFSFYHELIDRSGLTIDGESISTIVYHRNPTVISSEVICYL